MGRGGSADLDLVVCDAPVNRNFGLRLTPSTPNASEIKSVVSSVPCGGPVPPNGGAKPTQAQIRATAVQIAQQNYSSYHLAFARANHVFNDTAPAWLVSGVTGGVGGPDLNRTAGPQVGHHVMRVRKTSAGPSLVHHPKAIRVRNGATGGFGCWQH
jgi:hypothetical protein